MNPKVDLTQLVVVRDAPRAAPRARHHLLARVLPALLLAGFAGLMAYAARDWLAPPRAVTVVPVVTAQGLVGQPADTPLFRAAGWVEPRPTATLVTALAEGVVERLLVVEGQAVTEGQPVARLVAADARIALEAAEAEVQQREGELLGQQAARAAALARLERPVHLEVDLADADAALTKARSESASLPIQLKSAQARQAAARRDWDYRQKSTDFVSEASVVRSKSELAAASAAVEELQSRQKHLPATLRALEGKRDALKARLARKTDEVRQSAEAGAAVQSAQARLRQAKSARTAAELRLQRMDIRASAAGRVLALVARPGMRLTGLNPGSLHDSSTVLTLYDPASLQVRVDVRLDDVGRVQTGQKVRIECAALPGQSLDGQVLRATSQADVQKNTLSVKVAITQPPAALTPEMLCQVTFLAPPRPSSPAPKGDEPYRLLVPRQLIDSGGDRPRLWLADRLSGTARLRAVELGQPAGELVEVTAGLSPTDKLIVAGREGLRDGARVRVVGEDERLGIARGAN